MTQKTRIFMTALVGLGALAFGGCAGDLNPVRDVFVGVGAGAAPAPAPDFVEASRASAPTGYVPIAVTPDRETPVKTAEEVAALEAELEETRADSLARGDRVRRLAIGPAPEPVVVPPPAPMEEDLAPPPQP
jgi:hypothetical protein